MILKGIPKVFFRADANTEIGFGHVMRSIALAKVLKGHFHCSFIVRYLTSGLENTLLAAQCSLISIPLEVSFADEASYIVDNVLSQDDILVLDGYGFDTIYQSNVKISKCKIVCIDDVSKFHFVSDAIINHAGGVNKNTYSTDPLTELYLGPKYALVQEEFLANSNEIIKKQDCILICMGGSDKLNYTRIILESLKQKKNAKKCWIIIGNGYPYMKDLEEMVLRDFPDAQLYKNLPPIEMAKLMKLAAIAICPPSTIAYEYLSCGGELYLVQTAENQQNIFEYLLNYNLAFNFKDIFKLDQKLIEKSLQLQKQIFDGSSGKRLLNIFKGLEAESFLTIRKAQKEDVHTYFEWVNDPEVRRNSFSTGMIEWEEHKKWFQNKINSLSAILFIVNHRNKPMGQVRFDVDRGKAFIDYTVGKEFRGMGLSSKMLKLAIRQLREEQPELIVTGEVKKINSKSCQVFEKLNFKKVGDFVRNGSQCVMYQLLNFTP